MVVLSLCFSMLSMRAWDRLVAQVILQNAIYACMGQTAKYSLIFLLSVCYLCVHGTD